MRTKTLAPLLCGVVLLVTVPARANDDNRTARPPTAAGRTLRPLGARTATPAAQGLDVARRVEGHAVRPLGRLGAAPHAASPSASPPAAAPPGTRRAVAPALIPAAERTASRQEQARTRARTAAEGRDAAGTEVGEARREVANEAQALEALDAEREATVAAQRAAREQHTAAVAARQRLVQRGFFRAMLDWFDFTGSHARAIEAAELMENAAAERVVALGRTASRLTRDLPVARQRVEQARARVTALEERLGELDREAAAASAEVDDADRELDREIAAYERSTREDQTRLGASAEALAAHDRAAARFELRASLVSKPAEISQDAFATNPARGRFAVADGVTNSRFSGELARALVRLWAESPPAAGTSFAAWLRPAQEAWSALVAPARAALERQWFNRGASWVGHSTFAGVALDGAKMRAVAIGDALLLVVRDGQLLRAWPNARAADFSNETQALPSSGDLLWEPQQTELDVAPGDEVFLMSDAIGSWTLREVEAGRNPFRLLRTLDRPERLQRFVDRRRQRDPHGNTLDVDDTTIVRFMVPDGESR